MNLRAAALLVVLGVAPQAQCELDELLAYDAEPFDHFGAAVAISGTRVLVGAPGSDEAGEFQAGAAYVFEAGPAGLKQEAKLVASDAMLNRDLGRALALDGDIAAVATEIGPEGSPGFVYVFERAAGLWSETAKLVGGGPLGRFGTSVALEGTTLAVGAAGAILPLPFPGSVLIFERTAGGWAQSTSVSVNPIFTADDFGRSVSLDGDRLLIGASQYSSGAGEAYVYERVDSGTPADPLDDQWLQIGNFAASSPGLGDRFGWSVSLSGDRAAIGAPLSDLVGTDAGAVHVFERSGASWIEVAVLTASNASAGDELGTSVAFSGNRILVGSPGADTPAIDAGSVYVFEHLPGGWFEVAEHTAVPSAPGDEFGGAVALDGDLAVVGARHDGAGGTSAGSALVLSASGVGCPLLLASPGAISLATGGTQNLKLVAGPGFGNSLYLVLGSASGTSPGTVHAPFTIPLNIDSYFVQSLTAPNAPPFGNTFAFLAADGTGNAAVTVPAGLPPTLAGLSVHHAWVGIDFGIGGLSVVSAAKELALEP